MPLRYVVAAKSDIIAIIDRVYGFRSKVNQAEAQLGQQGAHLAVELAAGEHGVAARLFGGGELLLFDPR